MKTIPVLTEKEQTLRREIENHFLSCPAVDFAGVSGDLQDPSGKLVITLGGRRPRLIANLVPHLFSLESLQNRSYQVAIVRGRAKEQPPKAPTQG